MTRRLAVPAVAAMAAVVAATVKGLYVSPDGVFYVGTARNLVDGRGFTPPMGMPPAGHFPPLFTWLLAAIGHLGLDPLDAARVVNVAALGGIVLLVGLVVRSQTGSVAAALVASVLAASAVDLLAASGSALSEPLFVLLALASLVALAAHLDRGRSAWTLLAAAALGAAACLTRYVGVALVLAGAAALLRRRRWRDALVFIAVSVAPTVAWAAWAAHDRTVVWHRFGWDYLGQAGRPLARWVVPWPRPPIGLLLALALLIVGAVLLRRRTEAAPPSTSTLPWSLAAFAVAYLAVVVGNRLLTDATGRLDARFLVPLHVVAIVLVVPRLYRHRPGVALVGALVAAQVLGAVAWTVGGLSDDGIARRGYNAAAWRTSPVMATVAANDERLPLYSNAFDAIVFLTGEAATPVPAKKDYLTGRPNPRYRDEIETMRSALASSGGYLAWFDAATYRRTFLPSRQELEATLPLVVVTRDAVGTLYRIR